MVGTKRDADPESIDQRRAREHALLRVRRRWSAGGDDVQPLLYGTVEDTPTVVNDLDGRPLFYEFQAVGEEGPVGAVRASASTLLGPSVLSVQVGGRRWDPDTAIRMATAEVKKGRGRDFKLGAVDLVCYCWPKIGVRVRFSTKTNPSSSIIYDVASMQPVDRFGGDELEGSTAYSFFADQVAPQGDARARRWAREEENLEFLRAATPELFEERFAPSEELRIRIADRLQRRVPVLTIRLSTTQTVRFGPRCSPHECMELYAQQTDVYCAVATGQMILDFHKWHFTQDEIADTMNTGPDGTSQSGQIAGYEGRSNGCLDATLDESALWSEAKAEIDANRPFKSGIPGHARCGAGYEKSFSFAGWSWDRFLKVYDPWPWNADICAGGQITWEDWDTVDHTNFMYVRHRSSNHG